VTLERHLFADFVHLLLSWSQISKLRSILPPVTIALEHVPQLKKPFRVPRVAHTTADR
jgi:hypothetical protein